MSKQVITLSNQAANRIKEIMSKDDENSIGVRIGVKSGGCAGMSYIMEYAKEAKPADEVIEDKGVKVFIDPAAVIYLLGTEMDFKKDEFSSSFVFKNPNETERCGCGESFKV
jgi:iron-sulfur cluster assembly protein